MFSKSLGVLKPAFCPSFRSTQNHFNRSLPVGKNIVAGATALGSAVGSLKGPETRMSPAGDDLLAVDGSRLVGDWVNPVGITV